MTDQEEFLYLLNLQVSGIVKPQPHPWSAGGEQGFINEVYLWERLDLGLENNLFMHYLLDPKYTIFIEELRPVIYHFAGWKPESTCQDAERAVQWEPCNLYKALARRLCTE